MINPEIFLQVAAVAVWLAVIAQIVLLISLKKQGREVDKYIEERKKMIETGIKDAEKKFHKPTKP